MSSPIDWLGPIAGREMLIVARRRRYYFLRIAYGMFLLFVVFTGWQRFERGADMRTMPRLAATVVETVGWWQIVVCGLLGPVLLCDALSSERRGRNLDILLTTCLESKGIILAKFASRLLVIVQLLAIAVPCVFLMSLFGGVAVMRFVALTIVAFAAATATGSLALMFSVRTESPLRALLGTVVRLTWIGLIALPFFYAAYEALFSIGPRSRRSRPASDLVVVAVLALAVLATIVCILLTFTAAWRWLERLKSDIDVEAKPKQGRPLTFLERWNDKALERFLGSRNPLWADRGLDYSPQQRIWYGRILTALAALATTCWALNTFVNELAQSLGYLAGWLLFLATCLFLPFILVLAATNPLLDRRQDLWSLLRLTDLTNRELLRGTFLALWPVVFVLMAGYSTLAIVAAAGYPGEMIPVLAVNLSMALAVIGVGTATLLPDRQVQPPQLPCVVFVVLSFLWPLPLAVMEQSIVGSSRWVAAIAALTVAAMMARTRSRHGVAGHLLFAHIGLTLAASIAGGWLGFETSAWQLAPGYWIFRGPADLGSFIARSSPMEHGFEVLVAGFLATFAWTRIYCRCRFDAFCERPARVATSILSVTDR